MQEQGFVLPKQLGMAWLNPECSMEPQRSCNKSILFQTRETWTENLRTSFIHIFLQYLLSRYCVYSVLWGSGNIAMWHTLYLWQDLSLLALLTFVPWFCVIGSPIPCKVFAAFLVSTYYMPVATPASVVTSRISPGIAKEPLGLSTPPTVAWLRLILLLEGEMKLYKADDNL